MTRISPDARSHSRPEWSSIFSTRKYLLLALSVFFCWYTLALSADQPVCPPELPVIVHLEEMKPFPSEFQPLTAAFIDPRIGETLSDRWETVAASVSQQISSASLQRISRWAKAEMASHTFVPGRLARLPLVPVAQTTNRGTMLYSQDPEKGIPLPSHSPLVFRRLVVAVEFDTRASQIKRVFITIRGWREE